jgi:hypothetical protein
MLNYSISQLIEIYETELSYLLYGRRNAAATHLSRTPIPQVGDPVRLGGMNFSVHAVERLSEVTHPATMNDFLNGEDRKIIEELEHEGETAVDEKPKNLFDDDPYPDNDPEFEFHWNVDRGSDCIDLEGPEAVFKTDKGPVRWLGSSTDDTRETTIAYYRSFHSAGPAFGIYYRRSGLKSKARAIYRFCKFRGYSITMAQSYLIAKIMTQFHEIYHHKIEAFASRLEVVTRLPIYTQGFSAWYQLTRRRVNCFEETFANCYSYYKTRAALQRFLPSTALHNIMVFWFNQQPPPYRNALKLINRAEEFTCNSENRFSELILQHFFPVDPRFGISHSRVWSMFKHGKQPYITTNSDVYYIV